MICNVCGNEIKGEYLRANVDLELKPTENGDVVCSMECAGKYGEELKYDGNAIRHWSGITGYYRNVSGWNEGKLAELHDRKRFDV
jgi:anaerobic ribonucleoside-triphosphate reductase